MCVCCGDSFASPSPSPRFPHRRHCLRAFDHVRGRRFPSTQIETPPRKAGAYPLSNQATEFGLPTTRRPMRVETASEGDVLTTHRPMRVEAASEGDVLTTRRPMRGEAASEGDVLTTRRPMRGEAASEGDCLTPGRKKISRNARLVGWSSWLSPGCRLGVVVVIIIVLWVRVPPSWIIVASDLLLDHG